MATDTSYPKLTASASEAVAGKDILLAIYTQDGSKVLAVKGQQGLTLNRSADSIEVTSKDTLGGWKTNIAGMKEWSIDSDGLYVMDDEAHKLLSAAFYDSALVACKIMNNKTKTDLFGGYAAVTDYPLEAPYDDAMTYSMTLSGAGPLVDLSGGAEVTE